MQSFLELDQYLLPQFDTLKPLGSVKVTMQKFYRINGGATQLKGVTPDVLLPDPYALLDLGEKDLDYPMPWDEIEKATYVEYNSINYDKVKKASVERVKASAPFKLIDEQAKEYKAKKDDTKYSLKLEKYRAEQKDMREQNKKYDVFKNEIKGFNAELVSTDKELMKADTTKLNREIKWTKNIAKDNYIFEAANVVGDIK